jgi:ABC-type branched-subunit amino acid transport system permease subunit
VVHVNYVIAAVVAGLGGTLSALAVRHVDPEAAYWIASGDFVFVAILSGTGSVLAPFLGSLLYSYLHSYAYEKWPNTWHMVLGAIMLIIIVFLPGGVWSIFRTRKVA